MYDLSLNNSNTVRDNYVDIKTICHQQPIVCVLPHVMKYVTHFIKKTYKVLRISGHNTKDIYNLWLSSSYIVRNSFDDKKTICHRKKIVCVLSHLMEYLPHII